MSKQTPEINRSISGLRQDQVSSSRVYHLPSNHIALQVNEERHQSSMQEITFVVKLAVLEVCLLHFLDQETRVSLSHVEEDYHCGACERYKSLSNHYEVCTCNVRLFKHCGSVPSTVLSCQQDQQVKKGKGKAMNNP